MGELEPGDLVFDETGRATTIVAVTPPMLDRTVPEVTFSTGRDRGRCRASAGDDQTRGAGPGSVDEPRSGHRRDRANHPRRSEGQPPCPARGTGPIARRDSICPIEPYTLGAWLGTERRLRPQSRAATTEILEQISGEGTRCRRLSYAPQLLQHRGNRADPGDRRRGRYTRNGAHVEPAPESRDDETEIRPRPYLEAGIGQRLALLQGLMDTDGSWTTSLVAANSRARTRTRRQRRRACRKSRLPADQDDRSGNAERGRQGPEVPGEVHARPAGVPASPQACTPEAARGRFHRFRAIDVVREVASVPVRCIQVASPRGMFLVSRSRSSRRTTARSAGFGLLIHSTAGYVDPAGRAT